MTKYVAIQDRESGQWAIAGQCRWRHDVVRDPWTGRKKGMKHYQYDWDHEIPVNVSPFIGAHKIVEANNEQEALCLAQRSS